MTLKNFIYSERNAVTGSRLAAIIEGTSPAISVITTLTITKIIPCIGLSLAMLGISTRIFKIKFIGISSNTVITTPITPDINCFSVKNTTNV